MCSIINPVKSAMQMEDIHQSKILKEHNDKMAMIMVSLKSVCLGLNRSSTTFQVNDIRYVTLPLCLCFSFVTGIVLISPVC